MWIETPRGKEWFCPAVLYGNITDENFLKDNND